jgi:hypothetical protein
MLLLRLVLGLFGLLFACIGAAILLIAIQMHWNWVAARSWAPVQAQLLEAKLDIVSESGSGNTRGRLPVVTPTVHARYRYEFGGKAYESQRVTINNNNQNARVIGPQLEAAYARHEPVIVWVSPRHPELAVYSRDLNYDDQLEQLASGLGASFVGLLLIAFALGSEGLIFLTALAFSCALPAALMLEAVWQLALAKISLPWSCYVTLLLLAALGCSIAALLIRSRRGQSPFVPSLKPSS